MDDAVFGGETGVGVEVEQVDVFDPEQRRAFGQVVPDRVVDGTRDDPPIGQVQGAGGVQGSLKDWALGDDVAQGPVLFGGGLPRRAQMRGHSPG